MNNIERLQKWYLAQCNGDWEHTQGVVIESLDNPGWRVKIDLKGTSVEKKEFTSVTQNVTPQGLRQAMGDIPTLFAAEASQSKEWFVCFVKNGQFEGAGDGSRLDDILMIFLNWVEAL